MVIGTLELELRFSKPQSLKEKRMILKSLVTRIRNQFNVTIAEIDGMDLWQTSSLAIASIGRETKHVNEILDHVTDFIWSIRDVEIIDHSLSIF